MGRAERFCVNCGAGNEESAIRCFSCERSLKVTVPLTEAQVALDGLLRGRYRLLEQVGDGGYSAVYRAEDLQEKRIVAIKAISLRSLSSQAQIEATDTFNREVHFLTTLQQRNLPRVYEHFSEQECWYLIMEFIEGVTLEKLLEKRKGNLLPFEEALDIGLLLCDVLAYLHAQHPAIIFRDLKPANIMITQTGHLFLIDFGIARRFKPGRAHDTIPFGSPGYAAPEQYGRAQTTPTADIYSLGAILHQLLSGRDPSEQAFKFQPLPQQERPEMQRLSRLLLRMLEMDTSKRPQDLQQVKEELKEASKLRRLSQGIFSQPVAAPAAAATASKAAPLPGAPPLATGYVTHTAVYAPNGQVQIIQQTNQYYQGSAVRGNVASTNAYATTALIFSIIGALLPPSFCVFGSSYGIFYGFSPSLFIPIFLFGPTIAGMIFGLIGRRKAKKLPYMQHSLKTAERAIVISLICLIIYVSFFLCIFANYARIGY